MNDKLKPDPPLIYLGDFKSIELRIALNNLNSSIEIRDGARYRITAEGMKDELPSKGDNSVRLMEFTPSGMILDAPTDFCVKGDRIQLDVEVMNSTPPEFFNGTCIIEDVERNETLTYKDDSVTHFQEPSDTLTLKLTEASSGSWEEFKLIFNRRQNEIDDFLRAVKGGE